MNKHVAAGFAAGAFALVVVVLLWVVYSLLGVVAIIALAIAMVVGFTAAYIDYRTEKP